MSNQQDKDSLAAERQKRMAQIQAAASGPAPAQSVKQGADPYRGRSRLATACEIMLDRIIADQDQPRTEFDAEELRRLADSIAARGMLQPIRVRWDGAADYYVVVVGERRWRAAQRAGLRAIPCIVANEAATAEEVLEDQIIENCLRVDLNPMEQAQAFRALMTRQNLTQTELARKLNISQPTVQKTLALLSLPEPIKAEVRAGAIGVTAAYEASKRANPDEQAAIVAAAKAAGQGGGKARKPRPWTHEVVGVARVRVEPLGDDPDPHAIADALKAAERAWRKAIPKSTRNQDAA